MGNCGSCMSLKRIHKEIKDMQDNPSEMERAEPWADEELYKWVGTIYGPKESPYEGGVFYVDIAIPPEYPFRPPSVRFTIKIFHPNIDENGQFSLEILSDKWLASLSIAKVLSSLSQLLKEPNADDALVPAIAELFKEDRDKFNETVKEWALKHAN